MSVNGLKENEVKEIKDTLASSQAKYRVTCVSGEGSELSPLNETSDKEIAFFSGHHLPG